MLEHVDGNNAGASKTVVFGDFESGLLLMQGNVPDNVKKQKRLNLQGLRDRYGAMGTMDAKLDALVIEMETEYTAGVDYVPDEEEGIPGDGVEPRLDGAVPEAEAEP